MKKRGLNLLYEIIEMLANNKTLPEKNKDHYLVGKYKRIQRMSQITRLVIDLQNR